MTEGHHEEADLQQTLQDLRDTGKRLADSASTVLDVEGRLQRIMGEAYQAPTQADRPASQDRAAHTAGDVRTQDLRATAAEFTWMVTRFASDTAGVVDAIAVSSDGLLIAVSRPEDWASSERLAAIVSGLTSLAAGAAGQYGLGSLRQVIIAMEDGYLLVSPIGSGCVLGVVTAKDAELSHVGFEMSLFGNRVRAALNPQLISELKSTYYAADEITYVKS